MRVTNGTFPLLPLNASLALSLHGLRETDPTFRPHYSTDRGQVSGIPAANHIAVAQLGPSPAVVGPHFPFSDGRGRAPRCVIRYDYSN